jgi:hypothetical protein
MNGLWSLFFTGSEGQKEAQKVFGDRMAEFIQDPRLLKGFTPKFAIGCRRITPGKAKSLSNTERLLMVQGDSYMKAIQEPNVDVHFSAVNKITEDSVIDEEGNERKVDTIFCATGFDVSYKPRFPIVGQNGVELGEKWKLCPEAYLGITIPDMPNFITLLILLGRLRMVLLWVLLVRLGSTPSKPSKPSRRCRTSSSVHSLQSRTSLMLSMPILKNSSNRLCGHRTAGHGTGVSTLILDHWTKLINCRQRDRPCERSLPR